MKKHRRLLIAVVWIAAMLGGLALGDAGARLAFQQEVNRSLQSDARPVVVLPETEHHLGSIRPDAVTRVEFAVKNAGSRRLILRKKEDACCGGTRPSEPVFIEPGDSCALEIALDVRGRRGEIRKTIRYATNDPNLPSFSLTVSAMAGTPPAAARGPRMDDASP